LKIFGKHTILQVQNIYKQIEKGRGGREERRSGREGGVLR